MIQTITLCLVGVSVVLQAVSIRFLVRTLNYVSHATTDPLTSESVAKFVDP